MNSASPDVETNYSTPTSAQDQGHVQVAADDLIALCEGFLTLHEEMDAKESDAIFEDLLSRLYQHHNSYSAGVTSVTAFLQEL